ncbi:MBL fold metallo-hydrolase [Phycisphaerales bacterium AB-hyl4]|uniref:MBL fold metallo-hydrolase n=1 Tax=Natronomicrosphaera hydrolytica TaxID=3242702 RepID=A0ABV4UB16_9BACT
MPPTPEQPDANPAPTGHPVMAKLRLEPFRIQGLSVAGEHTIVQVPELELCFDMGLCPRETLVSKTIAISHGHIDHVAGLSYYLCQRQRMNLGPARLVCHPNLEAPLRDLVQASAALDAHQADVNITPLKHDDELHLHDALHLRAFETRHTVPSLGYVVYERRKRLRKEVAHLPFERLEALQARGEPVMERHNAPLLCYTGDTDWGPHFQRSDVQRAKVLITECTFLQASHREHARRGQHLHLDHIVSLLEMVQAKTVVLTHLPRQLPMDRVRRLLAHAIPARHRERVVVLMDPGGPAGP